MTKANECTCPSGDGSLRHPCPAHIGPFDKLVGSPVHNESEPDLPPLDEHLAQVFETGMALRESVEQAGGDERAAFEAWWQSAEVLKCKRDVAMEAWQARAALAQPSQAQAEQATADDYEEVLADHRRLVRELDVLLNGEEGAAKQASLCDLVGQVSAIVRERRVPLLSRSQAEDAPVIGCLCGMPMTEGHHSPEGCTSLEEFAPQAQAEQAEAERPEVVAWRYGSSGGIVSDKACLDEWKSGGEYQSLMTVAQHERIVGELRAENERLANDRDRANQFANGAALEINAALARVAELEHVLRVVVNAADHGSWPTTVMHGIEKVREVLAGSAPPAKAQHSVPEGWMLVECGIWTQEQVDEMQKTVTRFRNSEFVDDRALAMAVADAGQCKAPEISLAELLATAPGKEVPQAWIDVQAERRRQITAEGWTPEHDDLYCAAELPRAAAAYILNGANDEAPAIWPFVAKWWKPRDARSNYVRAGALILAEIERLDRAALGKEGV
ncbi:TPA: hypothetical protein ACGJSF_001529 [Pseudomonas aeruginosa]|uniref:hypothetical protein n=1 Tax=Pseudomonas aeruginosa TaxID=287 RepID=UPI0015961FE9|nr:hypothetical protein [Pseudomonas aeruginosa]